jgi:hypothetical protein
LCELEAFADGILAIVITIVVLERVSRDAEGGHLADRIARVDARLAAACDREGLSLGWRSSPWRGCLTSGLTSLGARGSLAS